jgi:YVTN family beta-propeller protein
LLSSDGKTLYVCNRFNNEVAFLDIASGKTTARVSVPREPINAALTPDGKLLFIANHIHAGRADLDVVASSISVIDTSAAKLSKEIALVNGSGLVREVAVSPDGKYAGVVHQISRFHLPTTQIERGWINNSALTLIDVTTLARINTVLLDNIDSGAANPWAVQWTSDGKRIVVTHAGTHELSIIDAPALLAKLAAMPEKLQPGAKVDYTIASHVAADVPNDLSFLVGVRTRMKLPETDRGPRGLALVGNRAYVANYFSDTITTVDLAAEPPQLASMSLGRTASPSSAAEVQRVSFKLNSANEESESAWPGLPASLARRMSLERKGEFYFNDGAICFQGWQSCSSCHSSDARVDGLNWDNLNDGIGNPKNAKSLLLAHFTPPSMWLSIREDAYVAVRAGIKNSLFTVQPPGVAQAIDTYLKSLKPMASPHLAGGKLSSAAERGKKLFFDESVGCADCHKGKYFTDQKSHDVGTRSQYDKATDLFDTPTLIEVWRSAPYLHDGSAATIRDVLTNRNERGEHGTVKKLTAQQIEDLVEFVLSL